MARRPLEERIALAEEKARQAVEQAKRLKAQRDKTERANDTRRKILIGALVLDRIEKDDDAAKWLRDFLSRELPSFVTRDHDRTLFSTLRNRPEDGGAS